MELVALAAARGTADATLHPITVGVAFALVGLVPLLFMSVTAFVKISTVLHIARSALGASGVPSGTILLALSFALTLVAMAPVGSKIQDRLLPVLATTETREPSELAGAVVDAVRPPLSDFLRDNASPRHRERFTKMLEARATSVETNDLRVLVPAFLVTELMEAFLLGFAIYLPFLVVDLVVANVLAALGLAGLATERVSLPLKLLLFVAADGWGLLAEGLITGYKA